MAERKQKEGGGDSKSDTSTLAKVTREAAEVVQQGRGLAALVDNPRPVPAPMSGGSQPPVTLFQGMQCPTLVKGTCIHVHTYNIHILFKIKYLRQNSHHI